MTLTCLLTFQVLFLLTLVAYDIENSTNKWTLTFGIESFSRVHQLFRLLGKFGQLPISCSNKAKYICKSIFKFSHMMDSSMFGCNYFVYDLMDLQEVTSVTCIVLGTECGSFKVRFLLT